MSLTERLSQQNGNGEASSIALLGVDEATLHQMQLQANKEHHLAVYGTHSGRINGGKRNERPARTTNTTNGRPRTDERRPQSRLYLELMEGIAEYFGEKGGNGLYGLLNREAPGLLDHPLRLVFRLINQYGPQATIEGYRVAQATGFPLEVEVRATYLELNDTPRSTPDDDVMKIFAQEQLRGRYPISQVFSQGVVDYRKDPTSTIKSFA